MPFLGPASPLPARPRRVLVAGTSGSGKTTLAARIGELLDIAHVEIDALHHGPNWTPRPSFLAEVEHFSAGASWVTEWQYAAARPLLADRAELIVWLDLPRAVVMRQVVRRTLRRRLRREVLWHGNIEPPLWTIVRERDHILRWAWRTHPLTASRIDALLAEDPERPVVRIRSRSEAAAWLAGPLAHAA